MDKSPPAVKGVSAGIDDLGRKSDHQGFLGRDQSGLGDVELAGCGAAGMNQISKAPIQPGFIVIKEIHYHPLDEGLLKPHLTLLLTGFSQTH